MTAGSDPFMRAGPRNLITDVPGLKVGQAVDMAAKTGVTVLIGDAPMVAGVHVKGGAPGTRETGQIAARCGQSDMRPIAPVAVPA